MKELLYSNMLLLINYFKLNIDVFLDIKIKYLLHTFYITFSSFLKVVAPKDVMLFLWRVISPKELFKNLKVEEYNIDHEIPALTLNGRNECFYVREFIPCHSTMF